tara:strand:+ start:514 stop:672 length:159 start_codon:yes stop_codon:yes gene_type:complete
MKVKIDLTVDISKESWVENYGCEDSEVRQDVKDYCEWTVREQLAAVGVLTEE